MFFMKVKVSKLTKERYKYRCMYKANISCLWKEAFSDFNKLTFTQNSSYRERVRMPPKEVNSNFNTPLNSLLIIYFSFKYLFSLQVIYFLLLYDGRLQNTTYIHISFKMFFFYIFFAILCFFFRRGAFNSFPFLFSNSLLGVYVRRLLK